MSLHREMYCSRDRRAINWNWMIFVAARGLNPSQVPGESAACHGRHQEIVQGRARFSAKNNCFSFLHKNE